MNYYQAFYLRLSNFWSSAFALGLPSTYSIISFICRFCSLVNGPNGSSPSPELSEWVGLKIIN